MQLIVALSMNDCISKDYEFDISPITLKNYFERHLIRSLRQRGSESKVTEISNFQLGPNFYQQATHMSSSNSIIVIMRSS